MPRRGDVFAQGQYYHIYNRGLGRGRIFFSADNYEYCLRLAKHHREPCGAAIIAYSLMPNHYHFLLRQETDQPLSRFVGVLFNAYVQGLNKERGRTGALFEGRFRHVWVDREEYLTHLCRYIHLNPVKARLVAQPEDWPFSNYLEWIGERQGTLKDDAFIAEHFDGGSQYRDFVMEELTASQTPEHLRPYLWD